MIVAATTASITAIPINTQSRLCRSRIFLPLFLFQLISKSKLAGNVLFVLRWIERESNCRDRFGLRSPPWRPRPVRRSIAKVVRVPDFRLDRRRDFLPARQTHEMPRRTLVVTVEGVTLVGHSYNRCRRSRRHSVHVINRPLHNHTSCSSLDAIASDITPSNKLFNGSAMRRIADIRFISATSARFGCAGGLG